MPAKSPLLPSQGAHWLPSVLPVGRSPSTHTIPCTWGSLWAPTRLCSGQRMGTHVSPYPARSSDTLFLRDARGLGLPYSWVLTHSFARILGKAASGQRTPRSGDGGERGRLHSLHAQAPQLHLAWSWAHAGACVLGLHRTPSPPPRPESVSSAVTIPRGGLTCCPCGRPSTAGWRPACLRARSRRLGIPLASAALQEPLREWAAAAACLLVGRTPAPRPPCTGPARPGEKALIGKIAQERGRGVGGRGRAVSSSTQAAWRRAPPSMSSPPFEDRTGDGGGGG